MRFRIASVAAMLACLAACPGLADEVNEGAADVDSSQSATGSTWWSLQPLSAAGPPVVPQAPDHWQQNPIDRFVYARLHEQGLTVSEPADARRLVRRVVYDLTGLPPATDLVTTFLRDCEIETGSASRVGETTYERLVDRLLASPRFGEHWGRHWLDVVRFGESTGFEQNHVVDNAWPYRDYVIRSLNADRPFDRMVREHLAADSIEPGNPDVEVGMTFLVCGPFDTVGNQDAVQAAQIRANTIDEIIRATTEAFLGLTVGCARCHDHKFDPISQRDYYRFYATFAGVRHGDRVVATEQQVRERQTRLQPLEEAKRPLAKASNDLERQILERAEARLAEYQQRWTRPAVERTGTEERFAPVEARYVRMIVTGTDTNPHASSGYRLDEFQVWTHGDTPRNVALASSGAQAEGASPVAEDFADAYSPELTIDGQYGARWIANGPQLKITLAQPQIIDRVVLSSDGAGAAGNHPVAAFVCEYRIEVSTDGQQWREVANTSDRQPVSSAHRRKRLLDMETTDDERAKLQALRGQLAKINAQIAATAPLPSLRVGTLSEPSSPMHVFIGGNPQRPGEPVVPASLETLAEQGPAYALPADAPERQRRLALADWIVAPENPLTPRVLANRIWHYHFGTGIVDTPSDFGAMGGRPTHPLLLDWLARKLQATGWRLKPLHKSIVMSQTYRQASRHRADGARVDGDTRLLWRFPPRRLSAEEIRDTMLAVSGQLDLTIGGPGFRLYRYMRDNVATYAPLDNVASATYRRAVYHQNARAARVDLLTEFDSPDCAFATPRRASTTTPLQALTMMNHAFSVDMSNRWAQRLLREAGADPNAQVAHAFALAFSRPPSPEESAEAAELIRDHGLRAFCRAMFNANELIYLN